MLPTILTDADPESRRRLFKIVNLSSGADVGPRGSWIMAASVETGNARLAWKPPPGDKTEIQDFSLGPYGLAIVRR